MAGQTGVLEHGDVEGGKKLSFCDGQSQKASNSTTSSSNPTTGAGQLSVASSGYAYFKQGKLDDTQNALSERSQSGRGFVTSEGLYNLMQEKIVAGTKQMRYRAMIMLLVAFAVILALSTINTKGDDNNTHHVVAVQSPSERYDINSVIAGSDASSDIIRKEDTQDTSGGTGRVLSSGDRANDNPDSDPSAILGSLEGNVEITPDSSTTGATSTPSCHSCSNDRTPWMVRNGKTCATSPRLIQTKCRDNADWVDKNWCQQSCFDFGNGYDGDVCCPSPPCPTCSDDPISSKALSGFADHIVHEAQLCPDCEAGMIIERALERYGDGDEITEEKASQLMAALNDNSADIFDNAKIALIERNGQHDVCDAGPELAASGNSGLCKSDSKKAKAQTIKSKILEKIDETELMGVEPDLNAIVSNVSEDFGLDNLTTAWLIEEDPTMAEEIKGHYDSAESTIKNAVLHKHAMEVGEKLNGIMDTGKDLDEAVSESGFTNATIEEAFRYFDDIQGMSVQGSGIKEELDNKGGNGKRQEINARVEKAYADRGWTKKKNGKGEANAYTTWEPPGGGDGSKWAKGQNVGVGTASEKGKEGSRGEFYTDKDGYLHFHPPQNSTSFEEMKKKIEEENGRGHSRRLMDRYIQDSHDIDRRLNERVNELHRHLSDISDLCGDELNSMGCFEDNSNDRDLPHHHGNVDSVQSCLNACNEKGFDFAGLQGGGVCYCGESYGSHGTSESCSMSCQTGLGLCGGSSSNSVYKHVAYRNIDCVGSSFENLASDLLDITGRVSSSIAPLTLLLDAIADGVELIRTAKTTGQIIQVALLIGGAIPYIGPVIKGASKFIDPVVNVVKRVADKAQVYQNNVGKLWQQSLGKLADLIDNMETSFVQPISSMGIAFSDVGSNQCIVSVVNELANMNVVGLTDQVLGSTLEYVETLLNGLTAISSALASSSWNVIQNALQLVVNNLQPVLDFFAPLEPLGDLLKYEVVLPWFQPPYTEKYLGAAYCHNGYYQGGWPNMCWENESWHWEEHSWTPPWYMRRTCHSGGYSERRIVGVWSGCYNDHYWSHTRGFSCSWSWRRGLQCGCPGGYGNYWWRAWECQQHCPGDRSMHLGYCYKNSCNSGFNRDGVQLCDPHKRLQNSHTALCDRYSYDSSARRYLSLGGCYQGCASGHSGFLGLCFPPAELRISIEGIFDAFQDIIDFIMDLPIVSVIMDAIDSIVGVILKPVTDYIMDMMGFTMPEFPDLSLDILPLDFFDDYSFDLPKLPDISQMFNLPETVMQALPGVPDVLVDCGVDVGCLTEAMGMNDMIDNAVGDVEDILNVFNMTSIKADVFELFSSITCAEWTEVTLPVEEFARTIPGIDGLENACDFTVPVCSSFDVSGAQEIIDNVFKPLFQNTPDTRRLSSDPGEYILKEQVFSKLGGAFAPFSVEVPLSLALSFGQGSYRGDYPWIQLSGGLKILSTQVVEKAATEYPSAFYFKLIPSIALALAPEIDFCNGKFSLAFKPNFSFSIVSNKGNERLFRDACETAKYYTGWGEYERAVNITDCVDIRHCHNTQRGCNPKWKFDPENELQVRLCTLKYGALSVVRHEWFVLPRHIKILDAIIKRDGEIFGTEQLDKKVTDNDPPADCQLGSMENALENKPANFWESKEGYDHTWPCIKYWFDQKTLLDDLQARMDQLTSGMVARSAGQVSAALWEKSVQRTTFSTSSLRTPIKAAYQAITGSSLAPANAANAFSTSIAVKGTHPFYTSTSIGANFDFNGFFQGFKGFDVGSFEWRHLFAQLFELGNIAGDSPNELKNGILKTWEWGATFTLRYKWKVELFDIDAWDVC